MKISKVESAYQHRFLKNLVSNIGYYLLKYLIIGPFFKIWIPTETYGLENIPKQDGAVIVSNHQAFIDHLILPIYSPRKIRFWAKAGWWGHGAKAQLQGLFFELMNQVPVYRVGGSSGEESINTAAACVKRGELFAIYPEGTRSPDGRIYKGRTGAVRVAIKAASPIIPSAIVGTGPLQKNRFFPRRGKVILIIGKEISTKNISINDKEKIRNLTDAVMNEISKLSGIEYVNEYARKRGAE